MNCDGLAALNRKSLNRHTIGSSVFDDVTNHESHWLTRTVLISPFHDNATSTHRARPLAQVWRLTNRHPGSAPAASQPGRFQSLFQIDQPPHTPLLACAPQSRWRLRRVGQLAPRVESPWLRFAIADWKMWPATKPDYSGRKWIEEKSPTPFRSVGWRRPIDLFHQEQRRGQCDSLRY